MLNSDVIERVIDIMEDSFPPYERRNREGQRDLFKLPEYQVEVIEFENEIAGFVAFWELENCVFVENLAVDSKVRGQNLGTKLMERVIQNTKTCVVLEVEPIIDNITERRVEFYRRLGFNLCGFDYLQPPLQKQFDYMPLMVMSYPEQLTEDEFAPLKQELYHKVYGVDY